MVPLFLKLVLYLIPSKKRAAVEASSKHFSVPSENITSISDFVASIDVWQEFKEKKPVEILVSFVYGSLVVFNWQFCARQKTGINSVNAKAYFIDIKIADVPYFQENTLLKNLSQFLPHIPVKYVL